MSRNNKAAGSELSAADIFQDPYEHSYSENKALEAYKLLSAKRGVMPPENMSVANQYAAVDPINYERKFGKNLYDA